MTELRVVTYNIHRCRGMDRRIRPERIAALPDLLPPLIIFLAVLGSIYAGWATATESAALGRRWVV